ncbi:sigma factor G inhibitor Gin [Schnuerera sp. xch1]|uniref:sigma factor G inhibitor Gin n=1 Tax=Schnuerera sp. xch1 TaxID=2874283 RepID=UPI001CBEEE07|nr:sigma factor G inhibitor Gin [Schnuerera sp. xch1]MBZ2175050.1 sigma factor G inhibitor Gin [Schnuerera sp. xch1]
MYCDLCHKDMKGGVDLLGANICENCFKEISTTSVSTEKYDYYKEMVKKILKNYIYEKSVFNPVE